MTGAALLTLLALAARNACAYTTRSYDLDVPGSRPIRIIEAEPGWDLNTRQPPALHENRAHDRTDRRTQVLDGTERHYRPFGHRGDANDRFIHRPDLEHRTARPDVIATRNDGHSGSGRVRDSGEDVDNSDKLKQFLSSYAENVKRNGAHAQMDNGNGYEDQIHLDDKFVDIPDVTEVHTSIAVDTTGKPEKSKSWNLLHFDQIEESAPDHKAWVSMDAVPWSVSKISKWHGKPKKDKYQNQHQNHNGYHNQPSRPYNDRIGAATGDYPRPNYPKPNRPIGVVAAQRPNAHYDDSLEEGDLEGSVEEDYFVNRRPSSRPSATYGHKVNLYSTHGNGNAGNVVKRPLKDQNCNRNHHASSQAHLGHHNDEGIITDGLPPNFPDHEYGIRRRGVAESSSSAGASHPYKGDVLPPLADGRVNMTTSHGGLLQVDGKFQSVEEAVQKQHAKRPKLKLRGQRRPAKERPQAAQQQVHYQLQTGDNVAGASDPGAVMAAVGAGMIPAGMALLVPMAMSGKRRKRQTSPAELRTASSYINRIELTLPSSL